MPPSTAPARQTTSISIESHVRLASPNVRRHTQRKKKLSPLQRLCPRHRDDQSTRVLRARAARFSCNVQVTTSEVSLYTPSPPPRTAGDSPALSPFSVSLTCTSSVPKTMRGKRQTWGTPIGRCTPLLSCSSSPAPVSKGVSPAPVSNARALHQGQGFWVK